jgi:PleD family two-component response regulator/EAL domain-containing protein (putative c-di-GMP-specific phosphodiesterase class I)
MMNNKLIWITPDSDDARTLPQSPLIGELEIERISDIATLPGMAGREDMRVLVADASYLEAALQLRDAVKSASSLNLPLLVISRHSDLATRLLALRHGADAFFAPPLDTDAIVEKIAELTGLSKDAKPYRVMVVDDDPAQANFAAAILNKAGVEVCKVTETLKILDTLRSCKPDLILMDVYMPDASGIELTTIIREHEEWMDLPIVYLSAEHDPEKQLDALSVGGEDFLTKPIRPKHLVATVRNRIDRARVLRERSSEGRRQDNDPALVRKNILEHLEKIHSSPASTSASAAVFYLEIDTPILLLEKVNLDGIDQIMSEIRETCKQSLQPMERISRFGDFCLVIIAQRSDRQALLDLAQQIKDAIDPKRFKIGPNELNTSVSIGLRLLDTQDQDASQLINDAIRACHQARAQDSGILLAQQAPKATARSEKRPDLDEDLLDRVMDPGNLQILYQPVVPLQKENEALYQCLLRLRGGNGGLLSAGEFLPTVEQTGKILKLDRWVILKAMVMLRKMQNRDKRILRLFVSQAESALKDINRIQWMEDNLAKTKVDGHGLVLEFRFPEITADLGRAKEYLAAIQQLGARVSLNSIRELDELLSNIEHLPTDYIKITENQIRNYPDTWGELVAAAHQLGKRIIVARIEHPELLGQLWSKEVDYIQGNFIQHPGEELSYDFAGAVLG